jgi:hypothetical protein
VVPWMLYVVCCMLLRHAHYSRTANQKVVCDASLFILTRCHRSSHGLQLKIVEG